MNSFLFPVEYKKENPWDTIMVRDWIASERPFLTFSFNRFIPRSLPKELFWLFLYYCKGSTNISCFKGKTRFRFSVMDWNIAPYITHDTFLFKSTEESSIWFKINRFEEIRNENGSFLQYEDFKHPEGKNLGSCLRNSISPAICIREINIVQSIP